MYERETLVPDTALKDWDDKKEKNLMHSNERGMIFVGIFMFGIGDLYTGCNRRNGPEFGRVFLRSYYTDITQNTYIQSGMVTEILAREV